MTLWHCTGSRRRRKNNTDVGMPDGQWDQLTDTHLTIGDTKKKTKKKKPLSLFEWRSPIANCQIYDKMYFELYCHCVLHYILRQERREVVESYTTESCTNGNVSSSLQQTEEQLARMWACDKQKRLFASLTQMWNMWLRIWAHRRV